jgi:hypothetical protein
LKAPCRSSAISIENCLPVDELNTTTPFSALTAAVILARGYGVSVKFAAPSQFAAPVNPLLSLLQCATLLRRVGFFRVL